MLGEIHSDDLPVDCAAPASHTGGKCRLTILEYLFVPGGGGGVTGGGIK